MEDQQAGTKHDANGKGEPVELESEQKFTPTLDSIDVSSKHPPEVGV